MSLLTVDCFNGKWEQQIGEARIFWDRLTEDELLHIKGHQYRLAGLIQARYAITLDEADQQVRSFFDQHES